MPDEPPQAVLHAGAMGLFYRFLPDGSIVCVYQAPRLARIVRAVLASIPPYRKRRHRP